ncbi:trypsin-like peptidase domain-containing protein [Demequina sp. NBRC 110057]|uniref:trypsin-like peptidase domain-containing protein n=1 Tax=Demequina sp. NBRC 110057 TaxID=1570346 RepID=UPI0009FCECE7|nr:trypsin-like peptidase domain-containing protein [Demequina sp. NBRC 110057]
MRRRTVVLAASCALALSGCAALPASPTAVPTDWVPSPSAEPDQNNVALSPDGFSAAQRMTVRVRNIGCGFVSTGSGFALDAFTLVTNRHVVADSSRLEVSTHDGRLIEVTATEVTTVADIAIVKTETSLGAAFATPAQEDPEEGDAITVTGYPNGGRLTTTTGVVLGAVKDPLDSEDRGAVGTVLATTAVVQPGSSGSPALNEAGEVVGVVYAKSETTDQSYIVPVSTLNSLLAQPRLLVPQAASCADSSAS